MRPLSIQWQSGSRNFPVIFPVSRELGVQQKVPSRHTLRVTCQLRGNLAAVCAVCYHDIIKVSGHCCHGSVHCARFRRLG
jgi:hypothetical protein